MVFSNLKSDLKAVFQGILVTTVLFLVSSYLFSMILGFTSFFFTEEGLAISELYLPVPIWLFSLPLIIVQLNIGRFFLFLWSVYVVCFIAAWKFRESLHDVLKKVFSRQTKKLFNNCLFAMPIIASMTWTAVIIIQSLQERSGIPTGEPSWPKNPLETFFLVSYSPLVEEIGFRFSMIGVFLIVYLFSVGRKRVAMFSWSQRLKLFVLALLFPDKAKSLVGVKTVSDFGVREGISLGEWLMITLTAVVFGLAHYVYGGGWQVGKITSAGAVGMVLALTYLLYGIQAPILLHWFFNYYPTAFELASNLHSSVFSVYLVAKAVTIILGISGWIAVMILGIQKVVSSRTRESKSLEVESLT